ncbi:MAG: lipid-binding SYLF domain-containing protein [Alphaproteobacteria bacterium]
MLFSALLLGMLGFSGGARAQAEEQALVDRATLTLQEMMGPADNTGDARALLRNAKGVLICPRVFRAGFFIGGEFGECVLAARGGGGSWSSPAFYSLVGGSFGLQAGLQDAQVISLIMTQKGLNAVLDSQFKFGAEAGLTFATLGRSIQGATTAAVGADIVTIGRSRGLFAGITLDGAVLSANSSAMRAYFGREASARQVVVAMELHNPGSDPLRGALMRLGAPENRSGSVTPSGGASSGSAGTGRVQTENLAPPPANRR